FLYHEAELLDERRYHDWLALFTDDAEYWAPVRENVLGREVADELAGPDESAYFEDTKQTLEQRVRRLDTGTAWAETPPSRPQRPPHHRRGRGGVAPTPLPLPPRDRRGPLRGHAPRHPPARRRPAQDRAPNDHPGPGRAQGTKHQRLPLSHPRPGARGLPDPWIPVWKIHPSGESSKRRL